MRFLSQTEHAWRVALQNGKTFNIDQSQRRVKHVQIDVIGCDDSENGRNHALLVPNLQQKVEF